MYFFGKNIRKFLFFHQNNLKKYVYIAFMITCKHNFLSSYLYFLKKIIFQKFLRGGKEMIADNHIHTPFCPHGTSDQLEEYVEWFISRKVEEISFTEHAPLPEGFIDSTPTKDSFMKKELLQLYLDELNKIKQKYKSKIRINIGLEIDFIEGFEQETRQFLSEFGTMLDDSILSVHFIKNGPDYFCIDYSADYFGYISSVFGSVSEVYAKYYNAIRKSIVTDLGPYKPKRIGHLTLARKFHLKFPPERSFQHEEEALLELVKSNKLALDYNGAGLVKEYCRESYPPDYLIEKAYRLGIPLVYGSDAHQVNDLGQGYNHLKYQTYFTKPSLL